MIKKIKSIGNLAVFKGFEWDANVRNNGGAADTFKDINIIYGRNYSGKTSLSRIIRALEMGRISDKYNNPEFCVKFSDKEVTQNNLTSHGKKIRVFNEDFIKENLKFIVHQDDDIRSFAILGENNNIVEAEIQTIEDELGKKEQGQETGLYAKRVQAISSYNDAKIVWDNAKRALDKQLSDKATDRKIGIKYQSERFGDQNYNVQKLSNDIRDVLSESYKELSLEEIEQFSFKGLGGIRIPKAFGGAFVSNKTLAQVFRILSKADANVGQIPQNQIALLNMINMMGNEQQKNFIFSEILHGKRLANGGPERHTKDSKTLETTLSVKDGQYILNGEKFYSTGSSFAHWLAIKAVHPEGHVVLVIIDAQEKGVEVINDWYGFGQRTTASGTVRLNQVRVNPDLIFDERKLYEKPNYRGAYSQLLQVAIDVGIAEAAFAETLTAVHKARPIIDAQVEKASSEHYTLQEVGKLNILLDASILLLDEAAEYLDELDQHKTVTAEQAAQASIRVAEAKVYANDAALQISEKLLELGGSRSCLSQHHLDQYWRNARVHTLHDPVRWKLHAIGNYYLNQAFPARHAWI